MFSLREIGINRVTAPYLGRSRVVVSLAVLVSLVFAGQLMAQLAYTADGTNAGASIAVLQLSDDGDTQWAVDDLLVRLSTFITDDPFLPDRLRLVQSDSADIVRSLDSDIVVYVTHGGPLGIVTGRTLTSWETMRG